MKPFFLAMFMMMNLAYATNEQKTEPDIVGYWQGKAYTKQEETLVAIAIEQAPNSEKKTARLYLPEVGVSGWPATYVGITAANIVLHFPSDSGVQVMTLSMVNQDLTGTWSEGRFSEPARVKLRKQEFIQKSLTQNLSILGSAGNLGVSLITPNKEGPFPLIIFLHGSGPESRDTSRFAAETFAELGIASAIFDKRGVKESDGSFANATFTDLVSDAITIAEHFSKQSNISDIGFFGHSQGGWIAPLAASQWEKSRFVITSAGPAVSPATEAEWEFVYEVKQSHPEKASLVREIVKAWHQGVRTDDFDGYISMRNTYQTESWYQAAGLNQLDVDNHSSFIKNYRRVMDFQPLPVIQQLDVPMLAMFGDNDESIDSVESFNILNQITNARPNIEVKMYSGYGHSLRQSNPGEPELRFPKLPVNYFRNQAEFILRFTATSQTLNIN